MNDTTDGGTGRDTQRQSLHGWTVGAEDPARLLEAVEKAFDYRGDVTVRLRDGRSLTGYVFDRSTGQGLDDSYLRLLPVDAEQAVSIVCADLAELAFTGKDAAHGKSWESWLAKHVHSDRRDEKTDAPEAADPS